MSFAPLSELQESRFDIQLPDYVPLDEIGVSMRNFDRLARLGGFAADSSVHSSEFRTSLESAEQAVEPTFCHDNPKLSLQIDTTYIERELHASRQPLRDSGLWVDYLNREIRGELCYQSLNHYTGNIKWGEVVTTGICWFGAGLGTNNLAVGLSAMALASLGRGAGALSERGPRDMCWSIAPGIHPDRVLALVAASRALKVVKKIDSR